MVSLSDIQKCVQCGDCISVCPIVPFVKTESSTPRGKIYFLSLLQKKKFSEEIWDQFRNAVFDCTGCGYCAEVCNSDVNLIDIWEHSRKEAVEKHHNKELSELIKNLKESNNIFGMDNDDRTDLIVMGVGEDIPDIEERIYEKGKKAKTVFFVGCLETFRSAQIPALKSQIKLIEELSDDYLILGGEEYCCGHPLGVLGMEDQMGKFEQHHKELFDEIGAEEIITNCPGCLITIKNRYKLDQRILHISEWINEKIKIKKNWKSNEKISFHEPCELVNILKIKEAPYEVLSKVG
ncbi:MAG: (Fe-S)-binding protein, partial [Candidatus Ranarchaeia archaeon]